MIMFADDSQVESETYSKYKFPKSPSKTPSNSNLYPTLTTTTRANAMFANIFFEDLTVL